MSTIKDCKRGRNELCISMNRGHEETNLVEKGGGEVVKDARLIQGLLISTVTFATTSTPQLTATACGKNTVRE